MHTEVERCRFCSEKVSKVAKLCPYCGKDLQTQSGRYSVVADGIMHGIASEGKTMIHGLTIEKAQELFELLNDADYLDEH